MFAKHNVPITVNRARLNDRILLNEGPVTNFDEANKSDLELFSNMYREMARRRCILTAISIRGYFPFNGSY